MTTDSPTRGGPYLRPIVGIVLAVAVLTELALALLPRQLVDTFAGRLITIWPMVLVSAVIGSTYSPGERRRPAGPGGNRAAAPERAANSKAAKPPSRRPARPPDITRGPSD